MATGAAFPNGKRAGVSGACRGRRLRRFGLALSVLCWLGATLSIHDLARSASAKAPLHFAPNHNFDAQGHFLPAKAGFNLADISSVEQLDALPPGVMGLVWVGQCNGADPAFVRTITPYVGKSRLFGFYLMDDPDPRWWAIVRGDPHGCRPEKLKAQSDWIHVHVPGALTFIVAMNLGSAATPSFAGSYNPENSHIDLFGIDPYPCRSELARCDLAMIDRYVAAAERLGIPRPSMVPVFQTFGGGTWEDGDGGNYVLPDGDQMRAILARWVALVPAPSFDYAYSWGAQRGDRALEDTADLMDVLSTHNSANGGP